MTVRTRGPIFDGRANWLITQWAEDTRRSFTLRVLDDLKSSTSVFRAPTGRYRSLLHIEYGSFMSKVLPGRLPYVRWLEGTSRRNQTTRFKGYHLFRNATTRANTEIVPYFRSRLPDLIGRLR